MPEQDLVDRAVAHLRSGRGESAHLEAKAAAGGLPKSLPPTLSAFSNGAGGLVLLGLREDDGFAAVPGFDAARTASLLDEAATTQMTPPLRLDMDVVDVDDGQVVAAWVPELPVDQRPCFVTAQGEVNGAYVRSFEGDRRMTPYELTALRENRGQPRHDVEATEAEPADLDDVAVAALLERVRGRQPQAFADVPDDVALRRLNVLVPRENRLVPSLAGVLTLCPYPQQFFPQLHVSFVHLPGTDKGAAVIGGPRFLDNQTVTGALPAMIEAVVGVVTRNMTLRSTVRGVGRSDSYDYPVEAVREAVTNAVMHRDYGYMSRGTQVQVEMYSDRLEVISPGGLFGPVTVEALGQVSSSRNGQLALLLADVALPGTDRVVCENRASGVLAMAAALRRAGLSVPRYRASLTSFTTTFPRGSLLDEDTVRWIDEHATSGATEPQRLSLALARRHGQVGAAELRQAGLGEAELSGALSALVRTGLLRRAPGGRQARYELSEDVERQPSLFPPPADAVEDGRRGRDVRRRLVALLDDGEDWHVVRLAEEVGLGRAMTGRYLNELIADGLVVPTAGPRARNRRYRKAVPTDG